jgi:hypothetical protein
LVTYNESALRPLEHHAHLAQLFDTSDSLATAVSQFIRDESAVGRRLLIVARARNWAAVAGRLARSGWPVDAAIAEERLTAIGAEPLLPKLMRGGLPQPDLFQEHVGARIVGLHGASPAGLSVYGELVELLAEEGNFEAVRRLEELWNDLGSRCSFKLLCGYSAAHFVSPLAADALREVRGAHVHVHAKPTDILSTWLLGRSAAASEPI